jgi:hypothetical protein
MPIHDWTRVTDGTFHAFHVSWVSEIQLALNDGLLPPGYEAQIVPVEGSDEPDVVVNARREFPAIRHFAEAKLDDYVPKRRTVVVRHTSGDRIVALVEIVSPGNKASRHAIRSFVEKAVEALSRGFHLLVVDLFPPTPRDPFGIHAAIWGEFADDPYHLPADEPLTLAAYSAGPRKQAWVEPMAVGRELLPMPLFLTPDECVPVPLESTYRGAYRGVPQKWKRVLEAPTPPAAP